MTMYEVPKMQTHSLDKFRNANIDYISGSQMTLSGNLYVSGVLSGATYAGIIGVTAYSTGSLTLTTTSGSTPHYLGSVPVRVFTSLSGSPTVIYNNITITWYPSGSTGIWFAQSGSALPGTVAVLWKAES